CRSADVRGSPPHHAYRPAKFVKTSDPEPARSTAPARSCPRPETQRSTESAPSYPASDAAPKDSPESCPSPSSDHSGLHQESPSPSECPPRPRRSSTTAAPPAIPHNSASASSPPQQDSSGSDAPTPSERPSLPPPAFLRFQSSPSGRRYPSGCRPGRPVPSESPSTARADSSPAATTAPNPAPRSESC